VCRLLAAILFGLGLHVSAGCLVLGLSPFYDPAHLELDDRLPGRWEDADDNVAIVVERSEWQSYKVTYEHPLESGALTGYLFRSGSMLLMDLTPSRGADPGLFVIAGHAVVRVQPGERELRVAPVGYEPLRRLFERGALPASLRAALGERHQMVLAGSADALHRWAVARALDDTTFTPAFVFEKR
jgi:hypothetical protein